MNTLHFINIPREAVEKGDFHFVEKALRKLEQKLGKESHQSCILMWDGYNDMEEELFEIPEVRKWVQKLVHRIPYIFYFINQTPEFEGYNTLLACLSDNLESLYFGNIKPISEQTYEEFINRPKLDVFFSIKNSLIEEIKNKTLLYGRKTKDLIGAQNTIGYLESFLENNQVTKNNSDHPFI